MARKLVVEVVADTAQFLRSMKASSTATTEFSKQVTVSSQAAAQAQVAAAVKTTEGLRIQAAEYRQVAAAAEKGSAEQVAAANLAAQAERRLAGSMGVTAHEASRMERSLGRAGRGALAGSGIFRGLGRSLAFASGGFIAFQSASEFLRASVDAAREAGVAQRSLAAQMKASGESFAANRQRIEEVATSYAKFGFNTDQVTESLTVLERGTGNINKAVRLQGLTADIARAKSIDLSAAATVVAKVFGGQETALRRAVPGLQKAAHGWDLLREAQQKVRGQAAANTTVAERFNATLHDTEVIVGEALLPALNKLLSQLGRSLERFNKNKEAQKEMKTTVDDLAAAFGNLATAVGLAVTALGKYHSTLRRGGGLGRFLDKDLFGQIFAGRKLARDVLDAWNVLLTGVRAPRGPAGMTPAEILKLNVHAPAGPAGMTPGQIVDAWKRQQQQINAAAAAARSAGPPPSFQDQISRALSRLQFQPLQGQLARLRQLESIIRERMRHARTIQGLLKLEDTLWEIIGSEKAVRQQIVQRAIDTLQLGVDRAGLTAGLSDDLAALRRLEVYLKARIKVTKDNLDLQQQLVGVQGQILQVQQQQAQQRAAARKAARERAAARAEALQFRALGLGPTGEDLIPGVANLQRQLKAAREAIRGTFLDTRKEQSLLGNIAEVLSGQLGKVGTAVRQKIAEILANIRQQLKDGLGTGEQTRFRHTSVAALISGLGLDPRQAVALGNRLATVGMGGTVHPHRAGAFAGAGGTVITGNTMHFHGVQDVAGLERQLTKRQAARPHNRRGAH